MINLNDGHNSDYYDEKILKYLKKIEKANLVEDIKFREVAKSKEAIEEILRVILKDDDLFKMFIDYDYENELEFPNLTEKKKEINGKLRGGYPMTGISREIFMDGKAVGIAEGKAEGFIVGMQELLIELYSKNMITKEYAAKKLSITEEEFLKLIK